MLEGGTGEKALHRMDSKDSLSGKKETPRSVTQKEKMRSMDVEVYATTEISIEYDEKLFIDDPVE